MTDTDQAYDVVIVGGGIAGSALATALARAGREVQLLEKSETFVDVVRGEAMPPFGVAEAQRLGLLDALLAAGGHFISKLVPYDETRTAEVAKSAAVDMASLIPGVPGALCIGHPRHCQALLDQAAGAGAAVRRGVQLLTVEAGGEPRVRYEVGEQQVTARARLIVGADGRASSVRAALPISLAVGPPRNVLGGILVEDADGWDADAWGVGTENDLWCAVLPQGQGRARVYGIWDIAQRHRFAGSGGVGGFLAACEFACCPDSQFIAGARPAGPLGVFLNNESVAQTPFVDGAILIGDAAGWTDPLPGFGLSSAYRDARLVSEILLASDDWSPAGFAPYAKERNERLRRFRFVSEIETRLACDFDEPGRARRRQFAERIASDPSLGAHVIANLAGPEAVPAEVFTQAHRAHVLGEA